MHGAVRPEIARPGHSQQAPHITASNRAWEPFIPDGSPYVGQAILGEPV